MRSTAGNSRSYLGEIYKLSATLFNRGSQLKTIRYSECVRLRCKRAVMLIGESTVSSICRLRSSRYEDVAVLKSDSDNEATVCKFDFNAEDPKLVELAP